MVTASIDGNPAAGPKKGPPRPGKRDVESDDDVVPRVRRSKRKRQPKNIPRTGSLAPRSQTKRKKKRTTTGTPKKGTSIPSKKKTPTPKKSTSTPKGDAAALTSVVGRHWAVHKSIDFLKKARHAFRTGGVFPNIVFFTGGKPGLLAAKGVVSAHFQANKQQSNLDAEPNVV